MSENNAPAQFPEPVKRFLSRLYAPGNRKWACHAVTADEIRNWQGEARPMLRSLLGLDRIQEQAENHRPLIFQGDTEDCGDFTRQSCTIETEPEVRLPFWLLKPKGRGVFPLAITPHGHDPIGFDASAGVPHDDEHARKIRDEDQDVAVQAVRHGFIAIAPATRGLARGFVTDLFETFDGSDCRAHFMHGLLAGRTSVGERVWDMERIIDWACGLEAVDGRDILITGNSGGGVLAVFAAACDTRIGIAVPSCSYSPFVGCDGRIQHHDCNAVPGIMGFGEFWDVAGLVAPRHFLAVHGRYDPLKPTDEVDRAVGELRAIYQAAGAETHFRQVYGESGHRFFKNLMWPFITDAVMARRELRALNKFG